MQRHGFAGRNVSREEAMLNRILISAMTLTAALLMSAGCGGIR
jgi:hypothetical protein